MVIFFPLLRYTIRVQRELELDERALCALREDRKRFLCKAIENYINCLLSGEEHDIWIFRLCSLWLENSGVPEINAMIQVSLSSKLSYFCVSVPKSGFWFTLEYVFGTVIRI